jgi:structural maintenance of chromosome 3 (chondroitin sulfate proteoglycan 6)
LRTFRGVSHHFTEVFSELVTGGEGKLIMRTTGDEATGGEELEGTDPSASTSSGSRPPSISVFQGVQVRVTFSATGQQFDMQQLSGGQKALVALALIFAIQRCDPAPFYLFDEIDQALDANYRAGVARLIQKQVDSADAPAQFITTTFRPELVEVASKCYGIALINKVSNIYPLDKRDAQDFVTNLMNEEEAVGQVTSVPAFSRLNRQVDADERGDAPVATRAPSSNSAAAAGVGAGRRRQRDPADEPEDEAEDADDNEDEDDEDGDDGGLHELLDVDERGEVSLEDSLSARQRGGRAGASSTSVGVGSGRVHRGSVLDSEDEDADADLYAQSSLQPNRASAANKSRG